MNLAVNRFDVARAPHSRITMRLAPKFIAAFGMAILGIMPWGMVRGDTLLSSATYSYTGSAVNYTVPANTNYLVVKAWGAGGGCWVGYLYGGAGGFAEGRVSASSGAVYVVEVGGGGLRNTYGGTAGWPNGASSSVGGGGGGGASIFYSGSTYIEAGGGGGASNAPGGTSGPGYLGIPGGLSQGTATGGGGGNGASGGTGGQNYFTGATNTISMGQTGFAATAVNMSDSDYPGGNIGVGGGIGIFDGNPGYIVVKAYQTSIAPTFSALLSTQELDQGQNVTYTIPASGAPTPTFAAGNLPPGLSCNSTTGVISGYAGIGTPGALTYTYNSTVSATNSTGTVAGTLTWVVTAAQIVPNGSFSGPNPLLVNDTVSLTQEGTTNFPLAWVWGEMANPDGTYTALPNCTSLQTLSYTLNHGAGYYLWELALDDIYGNYVDEWMVIGVSTSAVTPPTTVQATTVGSTFVDLSWSGATAIGGIGWYQIYRNADYIGSSIGTTFIDNTAVPDSSYVYTVISVSNNDESSAYSYDLDVLTVPGFEVFTPIP